MSRRWLPYVLMTIVLGVALFVGAGGDGGAVTAAARADRIARDVRCPTCEGLSVAESEAPASMAIREEIRRRVAAGESEDQVRAFLVSRYGRDIILTPEGTGIAALVWALPVVVLVCGAGAMVLAFRRRRAVGPGEVTADDRRLVERALAGERRA